MQPITIALIQVPWAGSREAMLNTYRHTLPQAAAKGASLVCLQEFSLAPYFAQSTDPAGFAWAEPRLGGPSDQFFGEMAAQLGLTIVSSIYEHAGEAYFDTALYHGPDGRQIGYNRKIHIPSGPGYHETHFFGGDEAYPVIDLGPLRMAAPTCYDQWFPELSRIYSLNGAEFLFYPTAIGSEPGAEDMDSQAAWTAVMRGQAVANGIFIAAANRVGQEGEITFYGGSFICDPAGEILAQAGREAAEIITATLNPDTQRRWRHHFPLLHQRRPQTYARLLEGGVIGQEAPDWLLEERARTGR
jgi:N-carbamoylputrescine amidase